MTNTTLEIETTAAAATPTLQDSTGVARATSILALGTIASRIFGLAQEILMAHFFSPAIVESFQIAITIPRDLYDLAISGHVNSAIVPVLAEYGTRSKDELWELVSLLSGTVLLILSGLVLALEIFAGPIVSIYQAKISPDAMEIFAGPIVSIYRAKITPEAIELTISLLRITSPALLFLGMYAILSGTLLALKRFSAPAFAAAIFNGTLVACIVLLTPVLGIERAAVGWLLAAAAQCGLQIYALRKSGIRLRVRGARQHPGVRRIAILYAPVLVSLIVDVLINRTFSYNLASRTRGSIAYMNWATSLREFPMGLVGTAISIAILPTLSRQALDRTNMSAFKATLGQGIRLALSLIVPATVGMFVLAGPLVGLLFEHGLFDASSTGITALMLRLYLIGIPFAAVDLLLVFAFYAQKDSLTPAVIGLISLAFYMLIALLLQPNYGPYSLMIADSVKFLIHTGISLILLRRRLNGLGRQRLLLTAAKVALATALMALVVYLIMRTLTATREPQGLLDRALLVFLPAGVGGVLYIALARFLRIREFGLFVNALRGKVRRTS